MPRILIDENRFQISSYSDFGGKGILNNIRVDCTEPSDCYKLKVDYEQFSGEDQWELDTDKYCSECKEAIVAEYNEKFKEFDLAWTVQVNLENKTQSDYITARNSLTTELTNALNNVGDRYGRN